MFCGDIGYRPSDLIDGKKGDFANPARYYWEQLPTVGRENLEQLFAIHQDAITRLLCESGYKNEHAVPEYLLHKTKKAVFSNTEFAEVAIYSIKELVLHSHQLRGFCLRPYGRKGAHKAPRFGIVQMQRMGNKQNPTQLQFNLQAGYFYKLQELAEQPSA